MTMALRRAVRQAMSAWQRWRHGPRVLILGYHRVNTLDIDPFGLAVSPAHFAEHLEVIRGYGAVHFGRISQVLDAPDGRDTIAITFDDGYADNLHAARPLLEKFDLSATLFATAGQIGVGQEFWWDELDRIAEQPGKGADDVRAARQAIYEAPHAQREALLLAALPDGRHHEMRQKHAVMTADELRAMANGGIVEIGAHTISHPRLHLLPERAQHEELVQGRRLLEDIVGGPVRSFAYPFGDHDARTIALVAEAGFSAAGTVQGGTTGRRTHPLAMPRVMVPDCDGDGLARILHAWFSRQPV